MSVRLQFPRGGFFSFPRQFVVGGAALNLSGGTLVAYLKTSPDDADADALASLTITVVDATQGTVLISLTAAQTASLPLGIAAYWVARATVAGATYAPEALHGPVVLTPLEYLAGAELDDTGISETLVPDETGLTLVPQWQPVNANLTALAGLTSAADTVPYFTGSGTAALATLTSYARTLLATATAAAARTALGLAAIAASGSATDLTSGTVPTARLYTTAVGYNITGGANLDALAGLTSAADKLPYFTGAGTAALTSFSATGRTLVNASALTAAGLGLTNGAAIDALGAVASNGLLARTAANTYAARTITGTAGQVTVTNGDGVAGAPTLSLPTALTGINSITSAALANLVLATGTFGTSVTIASATGIPTFATHVVLEGVTSTGATGTGKFVFDNAPTFSAGATFAGALSGITALGASGVVTLTNATEAGAGVGSLVTSGGIATAKALYVGSTTASSSTTTGSGIFGGGIGVAGIGWFGGNVNSIGFQSLATATGASYYTAKNFDTASFGGLRVLDSSAGRHAELLYLGSAKGATYGAASGDTVLNENTGNLIFSTGDTKRVAIGINGDFAFTAGARTSGIASYFTVTGPADTTLTAATESIGVNFAAVTRQWSTGATITLQRERVFGANTITFVGASTVTDAVNCDFANPIQGTNATLTNIWAIRAGNILATGNVRVNGVINIGANQVVGARVTGYTAMTGTPDKATSYATSSVTLAQLAGRVAQLQADLTTHGLIGP